MAASRDHDAQQSPHHDGAEAGDVNEATAFRAASSSVRRGKCQGGDQPGIQRKLRPAFASRGGGRADSSGAAGSRENPKG